ncbi:GntR family transcriptional regulator [Prosthecomicrobium hirschii]|uniref:GntR family transcriptional regulator n=1 Tax=Prosthecodimorpha hirschii TaxID=665126 RepID=UPI0009F8DE40|nr:GntR family transcriptional regulator [Prosthecomicrobium hirschii]MCW1842449.1 GntR family transcriptional regulator [Prosthecomicrobium hirschii]
MLHIKDVRSLDRDVNDPTAKGKGPPIRIEPAVGPAGSRPPASRTEAVHEALRQAIIEQRLTPGAKLPEDAIGEAFGASRTIAREALGRLAVEGLVELKPNRGAFVANPTLDEAREVFLVRRGIERIVAESLAGKLSAEAVEHLRDLVRRERRAIGSNDPESIRLAGEFHLSLARLTGNALLIRYVTEVVSRCSLILAMYGRPHSAECGATEHVEIIEALVAGDGARAAAIMDAHLDHVEERALLGSRTETDLRDILAPYAARMREM